MRPIRSISRLSLFLAVILNLAACGPDIEGTFYLSDEARKYMPDTTVTTIRMVDSHGISEEFYIDQHIWYTTHHYFDEWGTNGDAFGESFGIAYISTVNDYFFMYVLRAHVEYTEMTIEWNQKDMLTYNFSSEEIGNMPGAKISFNDSMRVRGTTYDHIIELDYSAIVDEIDESTPVKTYISGSRGLVKFVRQDGIVFERVP
ncbi:MAG: hypothetical protein JW801_10575 [Bacteroidales bacterium]|nr:hypothetical protein [Bacteroidales bacterium]